MDNIVIATIKSWNIENAEKLKKMLEGEYNTFILTKKEDLSLGLLKSIKPIYIFFPHWSWKIPKEIHESFRCIAFHMTDLPFGRGGSPLQNLIERKIYNTKISAIEVSEDIDSGRIYLKRDLFIGLGSAEEIFITASEIIFFDMIPYILKHGHEIIPKEQTGKPVIFKRRKPEQSDIEKASPKTLQELYDFIRMLDAEGYPKAFIKLKNFKIFFSEVHRRSDRLVGRFEIVEDEG